MAADEGPEKLRKRTPRPKETDIREESQMPQNMEHRPKETDIRTVNGCPKETDITSFTSSLPLAAIADGAPPQSAVAVGDGADERQEWAQPHLIEAVGKEKDWLLKNLAKFPLRTGRLKTNANQPLRSAPKQRSRSQV